MDGEKNVSKKLDAGKYYAPQKEYNQDIISQQLVEPVSLATDYKAIEANDTKYFESQSKCNLL